MKTKAFIFDFDGTLVDTQIQIHGVTESKILAQHGAILTPQEISERYAGIPSKQIFIDHLPNLDPDALVRERWVIAKQILSTIDYKSIDMLSEAVKHLKNKGYKVAIASASPKSYVGEILNRITVDGRSYTSFFDVIISTDEVEQPKPFPDVFLKAAELLGVSPEDCIVVGDAKSDMQAATSIPIQSLYLSTQTIFDDNKNVTRFVTKEDLSSYLTENF